MPEALYAPLLPCPFCGDHSVEEAESAVPTTKGGHKRAVYCNGCFSEGPTADTTADAIAAWNTRADATCSLRGGQQGWISVEERLPADEETVFCTGFIGNDPANERWAEVASHQRGLFYDTETGDDFYPPTHWKPLDLPHTSTQPQETQP